ncbi:hypothetical protein BH10PLA2_BH10PLA2_22080 [soil metagenome]
MKRKPIKHLRSNKIHSRTPAGVSGGADVTLKL